MYFKYSNLNYHKSFTARMRQRNQHVRVTTTWMNNELPFIDCQASCIYIRAYNPFKALEYTFIHSFIHSSIFD